MSGWIKLHRQITEHWIWQDPVKLKWWLIMLIEANHVEGKINIGNKLYLIKRGQSAKSIRTWCETFSSGKTSVLNFFDLLENDGMIKRETIGVARQSTTLININNYEYYNVSQKTLTGHEQDINGTIKRHERDTIEESKEVVSKDTTQSVDWDVFLQQFNSITGKRIKILSAKAKQQVKARLKEGYAKDDFVIAFVNCFNDSYHRETGHKYLTPEFITRSDKMEKYANMTKPPNQNAAL